MNFFYKKKQAIGLLLRPRGYERKEDIQRSILIRLLGNLKVQHFLLKNTKQN